MSRSAVSGLRTQRRFAAPARLSRGPQLIVRAASQQPSTGNPPKKGASTSAAYKHILLTILDANPFLGDGSKQALTTAVILAGQSPEGKVTTLVIDEKGTSCSEPTKRLEALDWHFREQGFEQYTLLEKDTTQPAPVLIGDMAEEISADLVLVSSEAVHAKHVDANLLAEMVNCPLLLLP